MPPKDALISAEENRAMFNRIARRYDLMNRLMSFGLDLKWRRRAVRELAPIPGDRYLDVGCGTGDLALDIARSVPGSRVIGIDPSESMLGVAEQRRDRVGCENVTFRVGDACALDMEAGSVAGVVTAFCVRNITDRARFWAQVFRVLGPGGKLVILELTRPRSGLLRWSHRVYTRAVLPCLGRVLADETAYQYLVASVEEFPEPTHIAVELERAGLVDPRCAPLSGGIVNVITAQRPGGTLL